MQSAPAPLTPPGYTPPGRKIGPADREYDERVVTMARDLTARAVARADGPGYARVSRDADRVHAYVHGQPYIQ